MARIDRNVGPYMEPGEQIVASCVLSGSRDFSTDVPDSGLIAVLTQRRILFMTTERRSQLHWWVRLAEILAVDADSYWQRGIVNKGKETVFVLNLRNGEQFVACAIHVVEGKKRITRFLADLRSAVEAEGRDLPGS